MVIAQHNADRAEWLEGSIPVSARYNDVYYSKDDPVGEARHVFLAGNGLPERFRPGFHVAELGFGTGLNMLVAADAWARSGTGGRLNYTAFEAHPMTASDTHRALSRFPEFTALADELIRQVELGGVEFRMASLNVTLILGDARQTLPEWNGLADAWFLDGFAPSRNPELWEGDLLARVAERTVPGGTFATYTSAGHVKRALQAARFCVRRETGFGRKRHMLRGTMSSSSGRA